MPDSRSPWRVPDFRILYTSLIFSHFASNVGIVAIPLVAVVALDAGPGAVGLLTTLGTGAFLLIGLPAGAWVDRLDKRRVLIWADFARTAMFLSVPLAWALDGLTLAHLYAVTLLTGCAAVFFDVGSQSVLPGILNTGQLTRANASVISLQAAGQVAGRGAGGLAIQALSAPIAVVAMGVLYLGSALRLLGMRAESGPTKKARAGAEAEPGAAGADPGEVARPKLSAEIREGLRHVLGTRELRVLVLAGVLTNLGIQFVNTLLPVLFTRHLGLSAGVLGLYWSVSGIGIFLGARCARPLAERFGLGRTVVGMGTCLAPAALVVPFVDRGAWLWIAMAGWFLVMTRLGCDNVLVVTLRQHLTPPELLGRMNATFRFLLYGSIAVGSLLAGLVGQYAGIRTSMWVGAVCVALVAVPATVGLRNGPWWRGMPGKEPSRPAVPEPDPVALGTGPVVPEPDPAVLGTGPVASEPDPVAPESTAASADPRPGSGGATTGSRD
ncbi:MFS transporter [Streptomyces sp. NPDC017979]|uniref:MFS transporter n=1 Tax=Streptomyces sp. NPDC017979 TaxID=3365024 RepID=UPI00379D2060